MLNFLSLSEKEYVSSLMHEATEYRFHRVNRWTSHMKALRLDHGGSHEPGTNTSKTCLSSASEGCFITLQQEVFPCTLDLGQFQQQFLTEHRVVLHIQYGTDK